MQRDERLECKNVVSVCLPDGLVKIRTKAYQNPVSIIPRNYFQAHYSQSAAKTKVKRKTFTAARGD